MVSFIVDAWMYAGFAAIGLWWRMQDLKRLVRKTAHYEMMYLTPKQLNRFRFFLPFMWAVCLLPATVGAARLAAEWREYGAFGAGIVSLIALANLVIWGRESYRWYKYWRESDDDFWRKKRKKVADKLKKAAGKLAVGATPVPVRA